MRNSIFLGCLVSIGLLGGTLGYMVHEVQAQSEASAAWDGLLVLEGGTAVANPAALTPHQLAGVQIIDPMDHITLVTCRDGNTVVNADCPGNPNDWREIRSGAGINPKS